MSWTYDALDRRITETQHLAGAAARTVGYAYDDDGNLAALGRPDGTVVAYAYDLRDQLTAVTADGPPPLAQYSYDEMGRRTNLLLENGQNTASTFDTAGRLLAHTHTIGGNPLDAVGYTLNANGWRTAIARPGGKDDTYTYDTTGQVINATAASTAGPTSESFAYDLASNRTSSTASPPDGVQADTPITYAANSLDQYTSLDGQAQTHDANGNTLLLRQPTQDDVTFEWDSENRMLVQERGGSDPARIVNHYDALHRRVKKEIYEKPGGTFVLVKTHTFIYDGWNVIEERQFNSSATLTALTRLTWGADLSGSMQGAGGVGGLLMAEEIDLADIDPPTAHYYWYDGNGNVTGITDDSGAIEGTYRYTSFGALAEKATTTPYAADQPWRFSTKYHDPEVEPVAGTYYYGYRHYMPSVGRWPSRDPIEENGGENLFGFLTNDPLNKADYLGKKQVKVAFVFDEEASTAPNNTMFPGRTMPQWEARARAAMVDLKDVLEKCNRLEDKTVQLYGEWISLESADPEGNDQLLGTNAVSLPADVRKLGDPKQLHLPPPPGVYDALRKLNRTIKWPDSHFHVIFTGLWDEYGPITKVNGLAGEVDNLILMNMRASRWTLPHEIGHVIKWVDPTTGSTHSEDEQNLMHASLGSEPDCQWCHRLLKYINQ